MKNNRFLLRYDMNMSAQEEKAEIMVYSQIVSKKYKPEDPEVTALDFDKMLKEAKAKGATKLHVRINSPGGNVYQAVAMRAMMISGGFEEITASIEGLCASAATLLVCIPGLKATIADGSSFMIHNPVGMAWGTAKELRHEADMLEKIENECHGIYADRTGKSEDEIKTMMDKETWLTAKEAVEAGFCDALLEGVQAAACVTEEQMAAMQTLYQHTPEMAVQQPEPTPIVSPTDEVSTAAPVTENKTNQEEHNMEIKDITMEQLHHDNPALMEEIVKAERQRVQDIDDLTLPGYEQMAAEAKRNGTSAFDFQKAIVKAQREKGGAFMAARQQETQAAAQVAGSEPGNGEASEEEMKAFLAEMSGYANESASVGNGMY